jgi:hypothetical protein
VVNGKLDTSIKTAAACTAAGGTPQIVEGNLTDVAPELNPDDSKPWWQEKPYMF